MSSGDTAPSPAAEDPCGVQEGSEATQNGVAAEDSALPSSAEDSTNAVAFAEAEEATASNASKKNERLTAIGTMIAAIAAAIGLIFAGVTTLYSTLVSQDQLQESKDSNDEEKMLQAKKVNAWVDTDLIDKKNWTKFTQFIYVENRSADTVYAPVVYFGGGEVKKGGKGEEVTVFAIGRFLPACTRIKIASSLVVQRFRTANKSKVVSPPGSGVGINFYDTSGVAWDRFSGDRTSPPRIKEVEKIREVTDPWFGVWYLEEIRQVGVVTKADNCSTT